MKGQISIFMCRNTCESFYKESFIRHIGGAQPATDQQWWVKKSVRTVGINLSVKMKSFFEIKMQLIDKRKD